MCPETTLDWIAFIFLLIGGLSWAYFVTDVNLLDLLLEKIWTRSTTSPLSWWDSGRAYLGGARLVSESPQ